VRDLSPAQVIALLGVRLVQDVRERALLPKLGHGVGPSQAFWADDGVPAVWVPAHFPVYSQTHLEVDAIHEALHIVLGPSTLEDSEEAFSVVEWEVCQRLHPAAYKRWRTLFQDYNFADGRVGPADEFLQTRDWAESVQQARELGWVGRDLEPAVWGAGPHSEFYEASEVLTRW
jgi:hypothetical protein